MGHIRFWSLREIDCGGMDWIHLIQDGDQCRAVATVMNFRFRKILRKVTERLLASQGVSSMELVVLSTYIRFHYSRARGSVVG
jgi:hypothetical protein